MDKGYIMRLNCVKRMIYALLIVILLIVFGYILWGYVCKNNIAVKNPAVAAQLKDVDQYAKSYQSLQEIKYSSYGLIDKKTDQVYANYHALVPINFAKSTRLVNQQKVTINIVGDVIPHADLQVAASLEHGYKHMFTEISKEIKDGDINIANLETPIASSFPYQGIGVCFNASRVLLSALKAVGFDALLTANNHAIGQYDKGYRETVAEIAKQKMRLLGSWKNDHFNKESGNIVEVKGMKIGLLNYTLLSNYQPSNKRLFHYIPEIIHANNIINRSAKRLKDNGAEYIILLIHWGQEYHIYPKKEVYALAQALLSGKIDLIVGGHPHVIQPVQKFYKVGKHKLVAYSLGNFISHQRGLSQYGLMAKIILARNQANKVVLASFSPHFFKVNLMAKGFHNPVDAMTYTYLTFKLIGIPYMRFLNYQCNNTQAFDCIAGS